MWLLMRRPAQSGYWRSALRLLPAVAVIVWHCTCPLPSASAQSFAIRLREVFGLNKPGPVSPPNRSAVSPLGEVEKHVVTPLLPPPSPGPAAVLGKPSVSLGRPSVIPAVHQETRPDPVPAGLEGPLLPPPRPVVPSAPAGTADPIPTPAAGAPPPGGATAQPQEQALLLAAARNAASRGDWDTAIARFEEYFRRFGDDPAVRREYAGILAQAGLTRRAIEQYQQLLERDPKNVAARVLLGDLYVLTKQYRQAVSQYEQALSAQPDNVEIAARLARAYSFDGDVPRALEVYDRYLAKVRPEDERVPRALGALLLDLGRYREALGFLLALRGKEPDNAEVLALLVRAYARLGERAQALAELQELGRKGPEALGTRLDLAETLYAGGDYEVARAVYQQILAADPANGHALVGLARIHLQFFQPAEAQRILANLQPGDTSPVRRIHKLTWAEYHLAVGEYVQAQQIYRDFLRQDDNDHEARLALAELFAFIREYEKAKAEFAKIPPTSALGRRARLGIVAALDAQWRLEEALDGARHLLAEFPSDGQVMAQYVRTLGKAKQYEEAVAAARAYLQANTRNEPSSVSVRAALARVLLDAGRNGEAVQEYLWLHARPGGRSTATYYGLAKAFSRMNDAEQVQHWLGAAATLSESENRNRLLLADQYYADNEDPKAIDLIKAVLERDPQNLAALIRLADAQLRVARFTADIKELMETCATILNLSPANVRGRLAKARGRATVQDFVGAVVEYDQLIRLDPRFQVPQREKARVLYSDHQFAASAAAYEAMQVPDAGSVLANELGEYVHRAPRAATLLAPCLRPGLSGHVLKAEVAKAIAASGDEDVRAGLHRLLVDYEARSAEQTGAHLEGDAKAHKDWRNYQAVPIYQSLIAFEPGNEEGVFDLGQVYGGLKQTRNALPQFARVLEIEPQHRESLIASERASLELAPQLQSYFDYFAQKGRDGLAQVGRLKYGVAATLPFGDENELVRLGFARASYKPPDDRVLDGNILTARVQFKCCDGRLLVHGQANLEQYQDRIHDRITYDAGLDYDCSDLLHLRVGSFLENVVENGESMRQDIYRLGLYLGADVHATRYWTFGGTYRFAYYSDVNTFNEMFLYSDLSLSLPPKQLKLVGTVMYDSFSQQTVFADPTHASLFGTVHPYFSPSGYVFYEGRVEWYHWISRDYFTYSNQCWYSLQYGLGWDSNFVSYHDLRGLFNFDLKPWLTVGGYAQGLLSRAYDSLGVGAFVLVRFPCLLFR
jgi:tetratricopeptide (TPR) repeat protein